ncbi:MAG: SdpI family protein [Formivibrio sp.]|nr:SdpI family protein [Formivibrio sp.]
MIHQPFFVPSLLFVLLSLPLILDWVPRNRYYGIRTCRALKDDASWYRINRSGGWSLIGSGLFYLAIAALFPLSGPDDFLRWLFHLAAFILPLLGSLLQIRSLSRQD